MTRFGQYTLRALWAVALLGLRGSHLVGQEPPTAEISGRLTYAVTHQGIEQALVVIPDAGLGAFTDAEGRYRIEGVPPGIHELAPTLVGCQLASRSVEVGPGQRVEANFELSTPVINLQGIVVTTVASETPEAQLPFSVGRVAPKPGDAASHSVGALIQGKVAGARVLFGSGQPGTSPSIQLRAPGSIQRNNDPLLVVDGVITHGGISDIDPMDVEEVQVLKGAAAAAGYGSRGEAGVIEIRTRRGPGAPARAAGPLIIVDGVATGASLADLDPTRIEDIRKLSGSAAAVLFGPRAEAGVILVSTTGAAPEASRPPFCVVPNWIR
jgi:TonB-dependent SusC/RagA subfamily outer membrane receptor